MSAAPVLVFEKPRTSHDTYVELAASAARNPHTERAYRRAVRSYLKYSEAEGFTGISKDSLKGYLKFRLNAGRTPATVNQELAAIKCMVKEALDCKLLSRDTGEAVLRVPGARSLGDRSGAWLSAEDAQRLILRPGKGKPGRFSARDTAILATLIGCGLRRQELAGLTVEHLQQRDGRWVILDLIGKHNHVRTVPVPEWTRAAIERWMAAENITAGNLFGIRHDMVYLLTRTYAAELGIQLGPHDLRRTFARLAHDAGASVEDIQIVLGHVSITTTMRYIGVKQNLRHSPGDRIHMEIA